MVKEQVLLELSEHHLLLSWLDSIIEQLHLLLVPLLQNLKQGLLVLEVNDIVFVSSFVPCYCLVRGESPLAIYSKLVLIFFRIQQLHEVMSWHFGLQRVINQARAFDRLSWDDLDHALALPIVEL